MHSCKLFIVTVYLRLTYALINFCATTSVWSNCICKCLRCKLHDNPAQRIRHQCTKSTFQHNNYVLIYQITSLLFNHLVFLSKQQVFFVIIRFCVILYISHDAMSRRFSSYCSFYVGIVKHEPVQIEYLRYIYFFLLIIGTSRVSIYFKLSHFINLCKI